MPEQSMPNGQNNNGGPVKDPEKKPVVGVHVEGPANPVVSNLTAGYVKREEYQHGNNAGAVVEKPLGFKGVTSPTLEEIRNKPEVNINLNNLMKEHNCGNLNELALKQPAEFIKAVGDWEQIRDMAKEGKLEHIKLGKNQTPDPGHKAGMTKLLEYRHEKTEEILKEVREEVKSLVLDGRKELLKEKIKESIPAGISLEEKELNNILTGEIFNDRELKVIKEFMEKHGIQNIEGFKEARKEYLTVKPLKWASAGSMEMTSDIDVNLKGDGTELAVKLFNDKFRGLFVKESGIMMDVNVYAKDVLLAEPGKESMPFKKSVDEPEPESLQRRFRKEKTRPVGDFSEHHVIRDPDLIKEDIRVQRIAALVHLRANMPGDLWNKMKERIPQDKENMEVAEKAYSERKEELKAELVKLNPEQGSNEHDGKSKEPEDNKVMKATNEIYSRKLTRVEELRKEFDFIKAFQKESPEKKQKSLDEKRIEIDKAITESLFFAQEAYHSFGAINSVVNNKQKLSKGKTLGRMLEQFKTLGIAAKNPLVLDEKVSKKIAEEGKEVKQSYQNLELSKEQLLDSGIEQVAFILEQIEKFKTSRTTGVSLTPKEVEKLVLKTGKYFHRLENSVKTYYRNEKKDTGEGKNIPVTFFGAAERIACSLMEALKKNKGDFTPKQTETIADDLMRKFLGKEGDINIGDIEDKLCDILSGLINESRMGKTP